VFDGKAEVQSAGHQVTLNVTGKLKKQRLDKQARKDDFYRRAGLRASYIWRRLTLMLPGRTGRYGLVSWPLVRRWMVLGSMV